MHSRPFVRGHIIAAKGTVRYNSGLVSPKNGGGLTGAAGCDLMQAIES